VRVLLDQNVPVQLRYALATHDVQTAYERGWAALLNGELISAAEAAGFELLITCDSGMRHQQNWTERTIRLLVLSTNNWRRIRAHREQIVHAVNAASVPNYSEIEIPEALS
jgi:hypothetical protein